MSDVVQLRPWNALLGTGTLALYLLAVQRDAGAALAGSAALVVVGLLAWLAPRRPASNGRGDAVRMAVGTALVVASTASAVASLVVGEVSLGIALLSWALMSMLAALMPANLEGGTLEEPFGWLVNFSVAHPALVVVCSFAEFAAPSVVLRRLIAGGELICGFYPFLPASMWAISVWLGSALGTRGASK